MPVLSIWSPEDGALGAVAPLALAASAGTALVLDLDPQGPHYGGETSLAAMVAIGPRRVDLRPARRGVAVLRNGGIGLEGTAEIIEAFTDGWPAVVLRLPPRPAPTVGGVVPVLSLLPGGLFDRPPGPAVYQRGPWRVAPPGPGVALPRPGRGTVGALLSGVAPAQTRWLRAWRRVWQYPWT